MEQELGSIMRYCHDAYPCKVYTKRNKEGFATPSLYFPPPRTTGGTASLSSYAKIYSWSIKMFDKNSQDAFENAELIADTIRGKRHLIPIVDPAGIATGDYVRISRVDTREIEENVAQIVLTWESHYLYTQETFTKMQTLYLSEGVK